MYRLDTEIYLYYELSTDQIYEYGILLHRYAINANLAGLVYLGPL